MTEARRDKHILRSNRSGFSLIELLVVIVITGVLIGLLTYPLFNTLAITQRTQTNVMVQDAARLTLEQVTREIQGAIFVYDNTGQALTIPVDGVNFEVPHAKVDIVTPKTVMYCNDPDHPSSQPRTFPRGDLAWPSCPHDGSQNVEARPTTPPEPSNFIVRYFVALKDPGQPYSSPDNPLALAGASDNTFVLYRAEFSPYDASLGDINAPDFFYGASSAAWRRISKVVGPAKNVDLVQVTYQGNNPVSVNPSIKFVPNRVTNDVLTPSDLANVDQNDPTSAPTVYRATSGHWSPDYQVRLYRVNNGTIEDVYFTALTPAGVQIYNTRSPGTPVFNITAWEQDRTITPANPEMMFTVDANKGQVSFAFPMPVEIYEPQDIAAMNQRHADDWALGEAGMRSLVLQDFLDLQASASNLRIVPGSVVVDGPDWTPGPNFGNRVRYTPVANFLQDPRPNEFRVDTLTGEIIFYSRLHPPMPDTGSDLRVSYQIQNNKGLDPENGDMLSADYTSKNLLSVQVAYRMYDSSNKVQQLSLSNNVFVRNFKR